MNSNRGSKNSTSRTTRRNRGKRTQPSESEHDHLDHFFARYADFPYVPTASAMTEFYRMCDFFGWDDRDDPKRRTAHGLLKDAIAMQFNDIYGTEVDSLTSWQNLCQVLQLTPVPEELLECRKAVRATHVNIVDLVDRQKTDLPVHIFDSLSDLQDYTKRTGKFFPKENAYAGGLLKYLLRDILGNRVMHERSRRGGGTRRRGTRHRGAY